MHLIYVKLYKVAESAEVCVNVRCLEVTHIFRLLRPSRANVTEEASKTSRQNLSRCSTNWGDLEVVQCRDKRALRRENFSSSSVSRFHDSYVWVVPYMIVSFSEDIDIDPAQWQLVPRCLLPVGALLFIWHVWWDVKLVWS